MVPEEWKENFRMCKENFMKLCDELRPHVQRLATNMRSPVEVERQVALTLYYLSDEGRLRKTANAFIHHGSTSSTRYKYTFRTYVHMTTHNRS